MLTEDKIKKFLENLKQAKIEHCQKNGLPIPTFEHEDDFLIPIEKMTMEVSTSKQFLGDGKTLRITKTYDVPVKVFITDTLPESCHSCPTGFQFVEGHPCGRNNPYKPEDAYRRPDTCRLRSLNDFLMESGIV